MPCTRKLKVKPKRRCKSRLVKKYTMERKNDENELIRLGFRRFPDWDFNETGTESYRLDTSNYIYRAHVTRCNGPVYANLGVIIDEKKGIVDRWRDCVSNGSLERKILFNESQCSAGMNIGK